MLGEGILETTTTTGTGDLTTSAVTGRPLVTDFFVANATEALADHFYYSITTQDSPSKILEWGIGWMSAAGTLKRGVPLGTYDAGTLTQHSASVSALSLPAGTKNVIVTPLACGTDAIPATDNSVSSARYHLSEHLTQALISTLSLIADRLYFLPFRLSHARVVDGLVIRPTSASAAGNFRIGLYAVGSNGTPGRLICGSTADTAMIQGSHQVITTGLPLRLPAGWYYAAVVADAGITLTTGGVSLPGRNSPAGYSLSSIQLALYSYLANGSTTLPDPGGTPTGKVASPGATPLFLLRTPQ